MRTNTEKRIMYHKTGTNEEIKTFLANKSRSIIKYISEHPDSKFEVFYKYVKHADLSGRGKARKGDEIKKNILNYMTLSDMQRKRDARRLQVAAQTNIRISRECLDALNISYTYKGQLSDIKWFVVNDTLDYFNYEYTKRVCDVLQKDCSKFENVCFNKSNNDFTSVVISKASHGIGGKKDIEFNNLRCSIFNNDKIYLLIEHTDTDLNVFILLEKAPVFFNIIGVCSESWRKYLELVNNQEDADASKITSEFGEKNRSLQKEWKDRLANEMRKYTQSSDHVTCPFTWKRADYDMVPMLFIASHIVPFKDCNIKEAFDINNGLLLSANADALFDKHLISVNDEGFLVFSRKINNTEFKREFSMSNDKIMSEVLTEGRKVYLTRHYAEFLRLENESSDSEDYNLNRAELNP